MVISQARNPMYLGRAGACLDRAGGPGKYDSASTSNSLSYAENHATCRRSCDVDAFCVGYSVYAPLVGGQVECKTYKAQAPEDAIAGATPSSGTTCYAKKYSPPPSPPPPPLPPLPPPCVFPDALCLGQTCGDLIGTSPAPAPPSRDSVCGPATPALPPRAATPPRHRHRREGGASRKQSAETPRGGQFRGAGVSLQPRRPAKSVNPGSHGSKSSSAIATCRARTPYSQPPCAKGRRTPDLYTTAVTRSGLGWHRSDVLCL